VVGSRVALNSVQKLPEIDLKGNEVVQPHVWYTCPAGKKAIVQGRAMCSNLGAATEVDLDAGTLTQLRWSTTGVANALQEGRLLDLLITRFGPFEVELTALQTLESNQNAGSNANVTLIGTAKETRV